MQTMNPRQDVFAVASSVYAVQKNLDLLANLAKEKRVLKNFTVCLHLFCFIYDNFIFSSQPASLFSNCFVLFPW